jgi:hypothetical protein
MPIVAHVCVHAPFMLYALRRYIVNKFYQIVFVFVLFVSSIGMVAAPQYSVSAKTCPAGQVSKNGKCVRIEVTTSRATRIAACILRGGGKGTLQQQAARLAKCLKIK